MSIARLVITAVVLEHRTQAEVVRSYGVSPGWVSKLVARYRREGETAFEPHSRRPNSSPNRVDDTTVELIVTLRKLTAAGMDAGAHTIAWHLHQHHHVTVSPATIWRTLNRAGMITPEPKKRPRSTYIRFQAEQPNECWQSDFTHWALADGTDVEIITWLDDHARFALSCTPHHPVTVAAVLATFRATTAIYGLSGINTDRQRTGLHQPVPQRTQLLRTRTTPTPHPPEERATQPPANPRQSRTLPADDEKSVSEEPTSGNAC